MLQLNCDHEQKWIDILLNSNYISGETANERWFNLINYLDQKREELLIEYERLSINRWYVFNWNVYIGTFRQEKAVSYDDILGLYMAMMKIQEEDLDVLAKYIAANDILYTSDEVHNYFGFDEYSCARLTKQELLDALNLRLEEILANEHHSTEIEDIPRMQEYIHLLEKADNILDIIDICEEDEEIHWYFIVKENIIQIILSQAVY